MRYNLPVGNSIGGGPYRRLEPHPASVGEARRFVRAELQRAGRLDLLDNAELLVSEVVTNALVHAGTPVEVTARADATKLRVEVGDGSHHLPAVRHHAHLAGTGRGLKLLHQLAAQWGADQHAVGKTVWFELESADFERSLTDLDPRSGGTQVRDDRPGMVPVELLNLPLLLHAAWQEHAEALLREFLLTKIDDEDGFEDLQAHAAASEAIALLLEHLPEVGLGESAEELMAVVSEPHVTRVRAVVPVPADAVSNFRVLDETLAEAAAMADAGDFLTAPTQPEIRGFRRWVCGQVERQDAGETPTPWSDLSGATPPPPARSELGWETEAVNASPKGLIGADDTDRIIAISEPALSLLGYDAPEQLVGQRLIAIIPPRFRQAHLSGFTRYFSTGRAPLLAGPVKVPALRRDGSETLVELLVEAHLLPSGRQVFVAELSATT